MVYRNNICFLPYPYVEGSKNTEWECQFLASYIHLWNLAFLFCWINKLYFSALTLPSVLWHCWLGVRKSIWPVKNLSDEVLAWFSVCSEVQMFAYGPADATTTPSFLPSLKCRLVLPFWCWLTQVVLEKRPLNGCLVFNWQMLEKPIYPWVSNSWFPKQWTNLAEAG